MKKLILILALALNMNAIAQDTIKNSNSTSNQNEGVTITTIGSGKNIEEAKMNAMRSALEQVSGSYLTSSTKITNDKIISDNISTITNGSIKKYEIINEKQISDGYLVMISSTILINKLADFVSEKSGDKIEVKGGLFVANIKQMNLNTEAEIIAIRELSEIYSDMLFKSYSFSLLANQPNENTSNLKLKETLYYIPIDVTMKYNSNITIANEFLISSLRKISIPPNEIKDLHYGTASRQAYSIIINRDTFYFRNKLSSETILKFDKVSTNTDYQFAFYLDDGINKFNRYTGKGAGIRFIQTASFICNLQNFENISNAVWCELISLGYNAELCNYPCGNEGKGAFYTCKYNYSCKYNYYYKGLHFILPDEGQELTFRLNGYYKLADLEKINDIKIIKKSNPKIVE